MSRKAIARRVERGSLRSVVRNGRRRIPRSELVRAGLLGEGPQQPRESDPTAPLLPRPASGGALAETGTTEDMLATLFREVLDRFERQSQEIAQYRALTVQAESLRLTNELADLRVRLAELERQPQQRETGASGAATRRSRRPRATWAGASASSRSRSKSCPSARSGSRRRRPAPGPRERADAPRPAPARCPAPAAPAVAAVRGARFGSRARCASSSRRCSSWSSPWSSGRPSCPTPAIAVAMALAWTLVAVVEWVSSERPGRR